MRTSPKETPKALERIRELLRIERQSDGQDWLVWKVDRGRCSGAAKAGTRAGSETVTADGYKLRTVRVDWCQYLESRVLFVLHHGRWPIGEIDHRNRDSSDQRIENFREVTHCGNMRNIGASKRSKSGFRGVSWYKHGRKWVAHAGLSNVDFPGRRVSNNLGYFDNIEDAKNVVRVFWYLTDQAHFPYDAFGLPPNINVFRALCDGALTSIANGADASAYVLTATSAA